MITLIEAEARREVRRGASDNLELLCRIFRELGLRLTLANQPIVT